MKKFLFTSILAILIASMTTVRAQDYPQEYLGLPGDNLNLYAVMNLFQESETLEAFETSLNAENSRINNLDLNGDNMVDYITVSDFVDGNVHTIVLRSVLDRNEYQDVAVFTVEKFGNGSVQMQLIGDEALYGRNYIVEPIYAETPNPGYKGRTVSRDNVTVVTTTYYEVAAWPVIRFMYNPYYVSWRSSWYWGYYPVYWNPWRPFYWHYYYGYHSHWYPHYYSHYRHWDHPRYNRYNDFYYSSVRAYSPRVSHRITEGHYKQTYSRPETRRDGEAYYASTQGTRSSSARQAASGGTDRRSTAASGSSTARQAASGSTDRRSTAATGSKSAGSQNSGQTSATRRTSTNVDSRSEARPSGTENRSTTRTATGQSGDAARRSTSATVKSTPAESTRSSSSTAASRQATTQRTQSSQSSAQRSQSTVQRSQPSRQSTAQKSSPSVSQRSSAPAARSQTRSSSSQGRSSSAPSRSSSTSSKSSSSKSSDSNSRSSRR